MRNNIKRALALLLAVIMIVPYAGCGKKKGETVTFNKNVVYREETMNFDIADGEELEGAGFIMQFVETGAVPVMRTGGVETHLEVLVIHINFMEGEFHVTVNADLPFSV